MAEPNPLSIGNTRVTIHDVATIIREYFNNDKIDIVEHSSTVIGEGRGFLSTIARVHVKYNEHNGTHNLPNSVVVKIPCIDGIKKLFGDADGGDGVFKDAADALEKGNILVKVSVEFTFELHFNCINRQHGVNVLGIVYLCTRHHHVKC